jgi:L-alanine-DL-glutamate epimerase-like enolase superfamily enzyme
MRLSWEPYTLNLRTTWRIAHGATDQRHNVITHIGEGCGEGAGVPHHGESQAGIIAYLEQVVEQAWDSFDLEDALNALPPGSMSAHAAIDLALHDLLGQKLSQPLYRLLGLNPAKTPETSFTISIDEPDIMAQRAKESGMPIIKIKLGSQTLGRSNDEAIVAAIRQATDARLRADANAGWDREQALKIIPRLADYDLEFIEQPLPVGDIEGLGWLHNQLRSQGVNIPIFADENVKTSRDVAAHAGSVEGVVIKRMKTGGIREALRAIHTARALDMQIMIGCMVETSVGVTAAAQLSPLCDFADLDGPLLILNDPYQGIIYQGARLVLPEGPGLGLQRR